MADPAAYHVECPDSCSLGPGTLWGERATALLVDGMSFRLIVAEAKKDDFATNIATLSRHRKHIVRATPEEMDETAPRASNIEILEAIIAKGFQNRKNWKPTISDTMKAMDMWFRLTQGNPFDELLDTLAAAGIGEETDPAQGEKRAPVEMPDIEEEE